MLSRRWPRKGLPEGFQFDMARAIEFPIYHQGRWAFGQWLGGLTLKVPLSRIPTRFGVNTRFIVASSDCCVTITLSASVQRLDTLILCSGLMLNGASLSTSPPGQIYIEQLNSQFIFQGKWLCISLQVIFNRWDFPLHHRTYKKVSITYHDLTP